MEGQAAASELRRPAVAVGVDWGEVALNGYIINIRRDEADVTNKLVYVTIGKGTESATFHGEYMKCSFYAYAWAARQ